MIKIICDKCGYTLSAPDNNIAELENGYTYYDSRVKLNFARISGTDYLLCESCQFKWIDFEHNIMTEAAEKFIHSDPADTF